MLRATTAVVGTVVVAIALTATFTSKAAEPTATPTLHMGKTAQQWHRVAVRRRVERDQARSKAGEAIRENRRLSKQLGQIDSLVAHSPGLIAPPVYAIARSEAARLGVTGAQWECLANLISRENANDRDHWNPARWNGRGSGAYGLPQALPGSKMASAGSDWFWNPATQVRWQISYVGRYGGPCAADAYQRSHHSY